MTKKYCSTIFLPLGDTVGEIILVHPKREFILVQNKLFFLTNIAMATLRFFSIAPIYLLPLISLPHFLHRFGFFLPTIVTVHNSYARSSEK